MRLNFIETHNQDFFNWKLFRIWILWNVRHKAAAASYSQRDLATVSFVEMIWANWMWKMQEIQVKRWIKKKLSNYCYCCEFATTSILLCISICSSYNWNQSNWSIFMIRIPFDVNGNKMLVIKYLYSLPYYREIDCREWGTIWQINMLRIG